MAGIPRLSRVSTLALNPKPQTKWLAFLDSTVSTPTRKTPTGSETGELKKLALSRFNQQPRIEEGLTQPNP